MTSNTPLLLRRARVRSNWTPSGERDRGRRTATTERRAPMAMNAGWACMGLTPREALEIQCYSRIPRSASATSAIARRRAA